MVKFLKRFYLTLIFIFLYAPIAVLIVYSFNESKSRGYWGGFTFKWYAELFRDRDIIKALYYTFLVALLSSIISTVIGTFSAIGIHNMGLFGKKLALNINYLPVLNPDIVTGIALMTLFISVNMRLGFLTMLISHTVFNIPYVILSVMPKLKQMDKNMTEAALDLGATPSYALRKVIIPQIMPGVITGALIAFTLSIDDFVISFFTTGSGVTNLSILVYSMAKRGVKPSINALTTLMLLTVVILLLLINKRTTKGDELIP
ncbi:spermidine/putrescine transport system permease protein PotC [Thermoclostridium stercorarium subsp. stercorarium DSM 8532]|jgi:spermidine/putrescine transport system permease protein|uniref:Spermidine/putrescine transport system permease protein PotC n=3 Tax=Thermoclostridium stercorarium TaxID=1510 RepID=L7VP57_THES1|nr:ABC transporter permease [Thermoclostridium stercorarium]AGC68226.1 spermidine/putrescine transport system permease protein PotC [Thermoclostridium stercorarium subsp. stercorarium DSM 8532]AGI39253.1 ABC transporter permease subunit-2 [Thermoclostridium stercorarium subsp. stercorarium DSM 8532]ANW98588.1 spermidine/putrescine ABC transporter permease [Thermoclostridium stercorarium subsp. thermolacticum DSM 2910]ANX01130.1 spermidine/putrescine ABC transporter permease [Thermoclostridium s